MFSIDDDVLGECYSLKMKNKQEIMTSRPYIGRSDTELTHVELLWFVMIYEYADFFILASEFAFCEGVHTI